MSPLYITGTTRDGIPLMGGIFAMKDQEGFPVDASLHECQHKGLCPDWAEYLADAGRQKQWKFDAAYDELTNLLGQPLASEILARFIVWGQSLLHEGSDFIAICERMMALKQNKA